MMVQSGGGGEIMSLGGAPHVPARASAPAHPPLSPPPLDRTPSAHSAPRDTTELRELVRQAADSGTALRLAGAGRWLDAGRPVAAARRVDLRALSGIVEYVPGDLTMTAGAGSTVGELQEAARAHGQFLPLDPWGDDSGTLGATLATASAGPLSTGLGLPRDVVLGVSVVTGTGELIRPGGRVVKNVAGFDLVRLMVGAWGTLGAITEATVRLRALPGVDQSLAIAAPSDGVALWLARLRAAPLHPLAMELLDRSLASRLGMDVNGGPVLLIRLAGNGDAVAAQRATLATFGDPVAAPVDCWTQLRSAMAGDGVVLRLSAAPSDVDAVWRAASALIVAAEAASASTEWTGSMTAERSTSETHSAFAHASVMRGVVRVALPSLAEQTLTGLLRQTAPAGMKRIFERLPAPLWPLLAPSAVADALSHRIRSAFDPQAILNPGILGVEPGVAVDAGYGVAATEAATVANMLDGDIHASSPSNRRDEP